MVIMEIVKKLSAADCPCNIHFYRSLQGMEVDLIMETGGKLFAYEIKWTQNPNKSMTSSLSSLPENLPIAKKGILAPVSDLIPVSKGISAIP